MELLHKVKQLVGRIRAVDPVASKKVTRMLSAKVYGTHGRLEIQELNISVPLYDARGLASQRVVDNRNSAAFMRWQKQIAIADHCDQANFSNLNKVRAGSTTAVIDLRNTQERFICVSSQVGHIRLAESGNRIFDRNWNPANTQNEGGLCIYTCIEKSAPDVMDVRLTFWRPITV